MSKLILHIGCHKTGTSSIQKNLLLNRTYLKKNNWNLLIKKKLLRRSYLLGNANSYIRVKGEKQNIYIEIDDSFYLDCEKFNGNVLISSEEFSWLFNSEEIKVLHEKLSNIFDNIQVVLYFRRQDMQLLSHYHQGFRFFESSAAKFFGRALTAMPIYEEYFDNYFNYYNKYKNWSGVFGNKNISVRWFSKETLVSNDSVEDFSYTTELDLPKKNKSQDNETLYQDDIILRQILFEKYSDNYYFINLILNKVRGYNKTKTKKFLPKKEDIREFYDKYHSDNIKLLNELFDKNPVYLKNAISSLDNFDMYPEYVSYEREIIPIKEKIIEIEKKHKGLVFLCYILSRLRFFLIRLSDGFK